MKIMNGRASQQGLLLVLAAMWVAGSGVNRSWAQGCLAAHTNSSMQDCLTSAGPDTYRNPNKFLAHHPLTLEVDWRSFSSFRHFSGTVENTSRQTLGTFIPNHQNLYNISLDLQLTPRWSVNALVPVLQGSLDQKYAPVQKVDIAGVGDMIVGVQGWVLRPPAENGGDIAFSVGLKLPTGVNNGAGTGRLSNGTLQTVIADQSLQPGDGM